MNFKYYINKKFTINYLQKFMTTTIFKHLELIDIKIEDITSKIYEEKAIENMSQKEYNEALTLDDYFLNRKLDFKVSSSINLKNMHLDEEVFTQKLNFIMYDLNSKIPKITGDSFFMSVYLDDIDPSKIKEVKTYYKEHQSLKNSFVIQNKVIDHYIETEALRTMIYLLQNDILFNTENRKKLLNYIVNRISIDHDNYDMYLTFLKNLILNKELFYKSKKSYKAFKKTDFQNISYNILDKLTLKEQNSLNDEVYKYLKAAPIDNTVPITNQAYKKGTLLYNLVSIDLDCILVDYSEDEEEQFCNLKKGLEVGLELMTLSVQLKQNHSNKKQRVEKYLIEKYNNDNDHNLDLETLQTLYHFNEHNAHRLLFLIVPLSHYLALTHKESFKVLQELGFYKNESINAKKGKFSEHFKFFQNAYNSNFAYLLN